MLQLILLYFLLFWGMELIACQTTLSVEFPLSLPGTYRIGFTYEGCVIEQPFIFETASCEVPLFIPNAFSPNGDGVNDIVSPFGVDFEGISLEIFDRWGGRLFYTNSPPFKWDGYVGSRAVSPGVYVLVFHYLNKRNGLAQIKSQEVLLLR